jgi:hypothetical protein
MSAALGAAPAAVFHWAQTSKNITERRDDQRRDDQRRDVIGYR